MSLRPVKKLSKLKPTIGRGSSFAPRLRFGSTCAFDLFKLRPMSAYPHGCPTPTSIRYLQITSARHVQLPWLCGAHSQTVLPRAQSSEHARTRVEGERKHQRPLHRDWLLRTRWIGSA